MKVWLCAAAAAASSYAAALASVRLLLRLLPRGPAHYYVRMATYYLVVTVHSAAFIPLCLFWWRPFRRPDNMVFPGRTVQKVCEWTIGVRHRPDTPADLEKLKTLAQPGVVVINHQHSIDVLGLFELQLLLAGPFGPMAWLAGTRFIDRRKTKDARKQLEDLALKAREQRFNLLVFAEGTRNHRKGVCDMLPLKTGAFSAAIGAGLPVLPVVFQHYHFLEKGKQFEPATIRFRVLEPLTTEGLDKTDASSLAQKTQALMLEALKDISSRDDVHKKKED